MSILHGNEATDGKTAKVDSKMPSQDVAISLDM